MSEHVIGRNRKPTPPGRTSVELDQRLRALETADIKRSAEREAEIDRLIAAEEKRIEDAKPTMADLEAPGFLASEDFRTVFQVTRDNRVVVIGHLNPQGHGFFRDAPTIVDALPEDMPSNPGDLKCPVHRRDADSVKSLADTIEQQAQVRADQKAAWKAAHPWLDRSIEDMHADRVALHEAAAKLDDELASLTLTATEYLRLAKLVNGNAHPNENVFHRAVSLARGGFEAVVGAAANSTPFNPLKLADAFPIPAALKPAPKPKPAPTPIEYGERSPAELSDGAAGFADPKFYRHARKEP